jgi:hypothetical protein
MTIHGRAGNAARTKGVRRPSGARAGGRGPGVWVWAALTLAAFGLTGPEAGAQELRLGASKSWANHALLGDPVGASVELDVRIRGRATVRLGYEYARRNFETLGSTCSGPIFPSVDCSPEPRAERSRVRMLSVGVPIPVYRREWGGLYAVPEGYMAGMSSRQHGERTGRSRSAEELMAGLGLGMEARVPVAGSPSVALTLGTSTQWFIPWRSEVVADGYTPFDTDIRLFRVHAGLAVALR